MKKKLFCFYIFTGVSFWCNSLIADQTPIEVQWQADVSSSFQFLAHSRTNIGNIGTGIQDAIMHAEIRNSTLSPLKATLGFGVLEYFNYEGTLAPFSPIDIGLHYGWIEYQSSSQWRWQMGQLQNQSGLENGVSTKNAHIQFGSINNSRSFYYPGLRSAFTTGSMQVYAEISAPEIPNEIAATLGTQYEYDYDNGKLALNLTHYPDEQSTYYNLSWVQNISMFSLGGVFDYIQLSDSPAWSDDEAFAIAGYLKLQLQQRYIALRGEYFDAGNTRIYGYERAGVITVTYGYNISPKAFMRFEGIYAKSSNNAFRDDKIFVDDQYGVAMQFGMRFGQGR